MTDEEVVEEWLRPLRQAGTIVVADQLVEFNGFAEAIARAVLAAVGPTIRADERERCAQIADARIETLCMVRHVKVRKRRPEGEFEFVDGAIREADTIAAAIRDDDYGRRPPR